MGADTGVTIVPSCRSRSCWASNDAELAELDERIESLLIDTTHDLMLHIGPVPDAAASLPVAAGDAYPPSSAGAESAH
jgi:hypothetical protein